MRILLQPRKMHGGQRGFTLIEILVTVVILGILASILLPMLAKAQENERRNSCWLHLRDIASGIRQYTQDYGDILPCVSLADPHYPALLHPSGSYAPPKRFASNKLPSPYGWADAIQPYLKTTAVYHCPVIPGPAGTRPLARGYTDYWYNRNLSGVRIADVSEPGLVLLSGDGNDDTDATNARYSLAALPDGWFTAVHSPARRHSNGTCYVCLDGHVEWLMPASVTVARAPKSAFDMKYRWDSGIKRQQ